MKLKISETLSLPIEAVTQTFAVLAKRGVGKTYTGAVMVEEMLEAGQQVIVADPIGVWWGLRSSADGKSAGYPIVVFGGEHADVPLEENSGEIIAGAIIENGFSAILDLSLLRKGAQVRFMTAFAETLYRLNRKPLHFAVDEADAFCPQRPQSDEARLLGAFEDIVRRGRARGIGVTLITQRAAVINKNVLTQIEVLVCLRTIAPQDRESIDAWIEVHGAQKQRESMMADLPSLPVGTAFFWSPGWLDIFQKVKIRTRRTFDSSSTPKVGEKIVAPKEVAKVNLELLGEQIKSTVEKSKANDPSELKREIARLKKEATKIQVVPAVKVESKTVPALTDAERKRLTKLIDTFETFVDSINFVKSEVESISRYKDEARTELASLKNLLDGKLSQTMPQRPPVRVNNPVPRQLPPRNQHPPQQTNGDFKIGRCERSIMTALAQYPQGRSANQVAILSGYSSGSGGFNNSLSGLRRHGLITRSNPIQITQEGVAALGAYEPLPTGQDLINYWLGKLDKCERVILEQLAAAYPEALTSQQVAEATGYAASSVGFNNALSRLRTLELITRGQPMKASDEFFQ